MGAVHDRFKPLGVRCGRRQLECSNFKEIIDAEVNGTIFETYDKDVCGISRRGSQWSEDGVHRCARIENVIPGIFSPDSAALP